MSLVLQIYKTFGASPRNRLYFTGQSAKINLCDFQILQEEVEPILKKQRHSTRTISNTEGEGGHSEESQADNLLPPTRRDRTKCSCRLFVLE